MRKSSSRRRSRFGNFLAVLLLTAVIGAMVWFGWQEKRPKKLEGRKPGVHAAAVVTPSVPPVEKPVPKSIVVAPQTPADFPRPVRDVLEAQVALARRAISPGSIDAAIGSQTRAAIAAFQRSQKLYESGTLDTHTGARLTLGAPSLT